MTLRPVGISNTIDRVDPWIEDTGAPYELKGYKPGGVPIGMDTRQWIPTTIGDTRWADDPAADSIWGVPIGRVSYGLFTHA